LPKNQLLAYDLTLYVFGEGKVEKDGVLLERYRKAIDDPDASLPEKLNEMKG
jgi:hypothetical protein